MAKPYHPSNFSLISAPAWKVIALAWVGKLLDVQFHIEGIPFGGAYKEDLHPTDTAEEAQ